MYNILTSEVFRILLISFLISILNVIFIANFPSISAIDYVDPEEVYENQKGTIYYSEDLKRESEEYLRDYEERVRQLEKLDRNKSFSIQEFGMFLVFLPWAVFPFLFPFIKKKLFWAFLFPILFYLFGLFSIEKLSMIGFILFFSYFFKTKYQGVGQ